MDPLQDQENSAVGSSPSNDSNQENIDPLQGQTTILNGASPTNNSAQEDMNPIEDQEHFTAESSPSNDSDQENIQPPQGLEIHGLGVHGLGVHGLGFQGRRVFLDGPSPNNDQNQENMDPLHGQGIYVDESSPSIDSNQENIDPLHGQGIYVDESSPSIDSNQENTAPIGGQEIPNMGTYHDDMNLADIPILVEEEEEDAHTVLQQCPEYDPDEVSSEDDREQQLNDAASREAQQVWIYQATMLIQDHDLANGEEGGLGNQRAAEFSREAHVLITQSPHFNLDLRERQLNLMRSLILIHTGGPQPGPSSLADY